MIKGRCLFLLLNVERVNMMHNNQPVEGGNSRIVSEYNKEKAFPISVDYPFEVVA